jgi:hypothetical protein
VSEFQKVVGLNSFRDCSFSAVCYCTLMVGGGVEEGFMKGRFKDID